MPVSKEYLEYVMDQLECCGPVVSKRMFGGIGLYSDALFFGLIDDDILYFKVDDLTRPGYLSAKSKPFDPYKDGNASMSYYSIPAEVLEDTDELKLWAAASVEAARRKAQDKENTRAAKKEEVKGLAKLKDFKGIEGTDFFEHDRGLETLLGELLPAGEREPVFASLHECARLVAGRWNELAREASRKENLPRIVKFDRAGNRAERVDLGEHTRQLRREAAEFGVLTGARSELHKFAMVYFTAHNGEGSLNCGFSCTDGLVRAIEARGSEFLRKTYLPRILSVETPLAGAQFVTERDGGSDIGAIECEAKQNPGGTWSITGEKWFCSNPDEYFLVGARPPGAPRGTAGVAIFLVPRVLPDGRLNKISFRRLKDKLGTQSLPTAEIDFEGATGWAIGEPSDGFKTLMNYVINTSRVHNAANACGFLHRAFLEARNYARQRDAFGGAIINYPLVQETLISLLETVLAPSSADVQAGFDDRRARSVSGRCGPSDVAAVSDQPGEVQVGFNADGLSSRRNHYPWGERNRRRLLHPPETTERRDDHRDVGRNA